MQHQFKNYNSRKSVFKGGFSHQSFGLHPKSWAFDMVQNKCMHFLGEAKKFFQHQFFHCLNLVIPYIIHGHSGRYPSCDGLILIVMQGKGGWNGHTGAHNSYYICQEKNYKSKYSINIPWKMEIKSQQNIYFNQRTVVFCVRGQMNHNLVNTLNQKRLK